MEKLMNWTIEEVSYQPNLSKYYEGLFTQGNGYVHVRGSYDEGLLDSHQDREYDRKPANVTLEKHEAEKTRWGTYIPGVVGRHPFLMTEIINLPYFFELKLFLEQEQLDMDQSRISSYRRWLSLKDGLLYREFEYLGENGMRLAFRFSRFISKYNKHLALQKVEIKCLSGNGKIRVEAGINTGVKTNGFEHFTNRSLGAKQENAFVEIETNGGNKVSIASCLQAIPEMDIILGSDAARSYQIGTAYIEAGQCLVLEKRIAFATDRDLEEEGTSEERVLQILNAAKEKSYEEHYEEHAKIWDAQWESSDILIEGDDDTLLASRMSIYHLLRCMPKDDYRVAICAKGYAGEAYFGRYFWDTEINMLPFFLHTMPHAARNMMRFRYEALEGAKRNAKNYGYPGARYPWESSVSGDEECANWQYADHEIHVTADVVYAMMHYVKATGDVEFLRDYAVEIMIETARYWCKRVDWTADGKCHLLGVMGPDEYLPMTADNTYTNNMVAYSMTQTVESLKWMEDTYPEAYAALIKKVQLEAGEVEQFIRVRDHLVIGYDENSEVILQSADFMSYADVDFDEIWLDRDKCFGQFISQEKNYRSKALKQADLLELILLFRNKFSAKQLEVNYDFYEPMTTHDSSLSAAVHGILCAWMGREEEAVAFLKKVIAIDLKPEKKGAEEGIHIANCGGIWQMLIYGFAGVKSAMQSEELVLEPHLPKHINRMEFPFVWKGKCYRIFVDHNGYEIKEKNE